MMLYVQNVFPLQVIIPQADPLFQLKRRLLQRHNLATQQKFQFIRHQVGLILVSAPVYIG